MGHRPAFSIGLIRPTRPGFVEQMLPEEEAAMAAHAAYLEQLLRDEVLLMAGPCLDRAFGFLIFTAESLEAAHQIMAHDPAVERGVMMTEVHPCRISFWRQPGTSALS